MKCCCFKMRYTTRLYIHSMLIRENTMRKRSVETSGDWEDSFFRSLPRCLFLCLRSVSDFFLICKSRTANTIRGSVLFLSVLFFFSLSLSAVACSSYACGLVKNLYPPKPLIHCCNGRCYGDRLCTVANLKWKKKALQIRKKANSTYKLNRYWFQWK